MECILNNKMLSEEYADLIVDSDIYMNEEGFIYINPRHSIMNVSITKLNKCNLGVYGYHNIPKCYTLESLNSLEESGVTRIQNNPNFALKGLGLLIGIIDTGIDYQHEAFLYPDRSTKISSIWDQTRQNNMDVSENVEFGTEYNREMINLALVNENPLKIVPSTDEIGHGTMIAGIIAGNESLSNDFRGVVPNAEFVVVKLKQAKNFVRDYFGIPRDAICYQESDIMFGVKYVIEKAQQLGKPIAICIALGSSQGSHDGRGALSAYLSSYTDNPGTVIVNSAGNEGATRRHYFGTLTTERKFDEFELNVGKSEPGFSMEIWQSAPHLLTIEATSPSGDTISPIFPSRNECRRISLVFERTIVYINNIISEAKSGDQLILVRFEYPTEGIWRFRVNSIEGLASTYNVWLPSGSLISEQTYFLNSSPDITLTSPSNAPYTISITSYNHENDIIWLSSSRGYTRVNTIKPDLAAPGVNIVCPLVNNRYGKTTGTGAAAAHATGIAAMFLEWGIVRGKYPSINGTEIRQILIRGAKRDRQLIYPNNIWGYGIIDVFNSFSSLR